MGRGEIGSYLGLTIETVSRVFSRLQEEGYVNVQKRDICLKNVPGLRKLIGKNDMNTRDLAARPGALHAVA
jgi:CRP/FNR family transcriptional regulator